MELRHILPVSILFAAATTPLAASGGQDPAPEKPETVKRPNKPKTDPDPKELEVEPDADQLVGFQFHGQPWPAVIEWYSRITGRSIDWRELPAGVARPFIQGLLSFRSQFVLAIATVSIEIIPLDFSIKPGVDNRDGS